MNPEQVTEIINLGWSIYTLLAFTVIASAGGLVIYWMLKPIRIIMNGGFF